LFSHANREGFRKGERILYGIFIVLASVIVISILAGAVTMSCGQLL
jgi:cell division protein FtsL